MSLETPPEVFETTKQYLVAYLMMNGISHQNVEYRQGDDKRWYSFFGFERTEDLERLLSLYDRRQEDAKLVRAYIDCLFGVKDILRENRTKPTQPEKRRG